ncbi:MAG: glycosyltransferase family 1 protein [bacterium]
MRIVATGLVGQYPFGGVVWDYLQYLLGFRALGHDVYYLEDSGSWPYDPINKTISADCSYNVRFLGQIMEEFGLGDKWIYRNAADNKFHGAGEKLARELLKDGDLLLNVSTASWLRDYDMGIKHQMFIDGDPMFTQIGLLDAKQSDYAARLRAHDSHFTFGLKVGDADCKAPDTGIRWKKTVQPIALEYWPFEKDESNGHFTTVMNWASYKPTEWQGAIYGQKDLEFQKFMDLPQHTPQSFLVAMGQGVGSKRPTELLKQKGWQIVEPDEEIPDHRTYREFLRKSKAEWSVAKHGYVAGNTGWFSCRSACYLALGRPVLVQDTGWTEKLPHGEGLLAFRTMDDCVSGIESINRDYEKHRRAARAFAEKYLDAKIVCHDLLVQAGLEKK